MPSEIHVSSDRALLVSLGMSGLALVLASATFVLSLDDDGREREVEQRLACLELPGPNDCGLDGR